VTPRKQSIVVLGAGLAGLRAAYELAQRGHAVELLEQHDEAGGMARSHEHMGYVFDHGPHGFWSRDEWINDEFKGLVDGGGGYNWLTKWSQIHYREEYFNFPLRISDIISKMPPWTVLLAFFSFLWSRLRLKLFRREPATTEDYLIDQFGEVLYRAFFGPYTRRVWDVDPKKLDVDFARDRVPSLHLWDTLRKLFTDPVKEQMLITPSGRVITHDLHTFYYPKRGAGALPRGYVRRIEELGGRFRYGVTLHGVDLATKTVTGTSDGAAFALAYDGLLSTIPIDALVPLVTPAPPPEIRDLARGIRYRAILLVNLCVAKPQVIGPFWIYYTSRVFTRISEYRHFSADLAPPGKTGICLEVTCDVGDEMWNFDDAEVVRRCVPDLEALGLARGDEIEGYEVIREANAYPLYDVGYKPRINRLVTWLESDARIITAGRQGRFLYCNQDAAIKSGREAGEAMATLLETDIPTRSTARWGGPVSM